MCVQLCLSEIRVRLEFNEQHNAFTEYFVVYSHCTADGNLIRQFGKMTFDLSWMNLGKHVYCQKPLTGSSDEQQKWEFVKSITGDHKPATMLRADSSHF